jgi:hypothetical protein
MTAAEIYDASRIKPKRRRGSKLEMEERAEFYISYAEEQAPVTVRQLYYQAEVRGVPGIDKTENSYNKVQRQILKLRRAGRLPYEHISDATRWMRRPQTWNSVEDALRETAAIYRKALWRDQGIDVEVWLEKNALAGVIYPVTAMLDVPLMPTIGYTSETFAFEAVEAADPSRPYFIYSLYDFDRSSQDASRSLQEKVERFAEKKGVQVVFEQLAISEKDIRHFNPADHKAIVALPGVGFRYLPTREPKRKSAADKKWPHNFCIELDAIEPEDLRAMIRRALERHLPPDQLKILKAAEASERELIAGLVGKIANGGEP